MDDAMRINVGISRGRSQEEISAQLLQLTSDIADEMIETAEEYEP